MPRRFRFGATDGERFSEYWTLATPAHRSELVVSHSMTGEFMHITMHEDPAHWHIKFDDEGYRGWSPPDEIGAGVRMLAVFYMPIEAIRHRHGVSRVHWSRVADDPRKWIAFLLFHSKRQDQPSDADIVGSVTLADGSLAFVVTELVDASDVSFGVAEEDRARLFQAQAQGASMLMHVVADDGVLLFLHLNSRPRNEAPET